MPPQMPTGQASAYSRYGSYGRSAYARPARSLPESLKRIQLGPFNGLQVACVLLVLLVVLVAANISAHVWGKPDDKATNNQAVNEPVELTPEELAAQAQAELEKKHQALLQSINRGALADLMGAGDADALVQAAKSNIDIAEIAANFKEYAWDGDAVQAKLLRLAANDPMAVQYVKDWPSRYPSGVSGGAPYSASAPGTSGVPLLFQWDQRWGYTTYSSASFGLTGCCPTSFCMAYQGLTGKTDLSPADFGFLAESDGYMSQYNGTDSSFLVDDAEVVGLRCSRIYIERYALSVALEDGAVVVCNVGPGDFTNDGHFIVLTGFDQDGKLTVNDPYSSVRSAQTWDVDQILGQTIALFAFYLA